VVGGVERSESFGHSRIGFVEPHAGSLRNKNKKVSSAILGAQIRREDQSRGERKVSISRREKTLGGILLFNIIGGGGV